MSPTSPELTFAILAGGRGARMGGTDKGLLEVAGRPLIEHVLARVRPQATHIVISANRNLERYARYGYPLLRDDNEDFDGPLAGIAAVLAAATTESVLFAPTDAVLLPVDYVQKMVAAVRSHASGICVADDGDGWMPVCCLVPRRLAADLRERLARGERRVKSWLQEHGAQAVDFSGWRREFRSVNTPEQLAALEPLLKQYQS